MRVDIYLLIRKLLDTSPLRDAGGIMQGHVTKIEPKIGKLSKQKYQLVGEHGGVKVCHWTKQSLIADRSYTGHILRDRKSRMYADGSKCGYMQSWMHLLLEEPHSDSLNKIDDDLYELYLESVKALKTSTGFGGNPKADKKFLEAQNPSMLLSL